MRTARGPGSGARRGGLGVGVGAACLVLLVGLVLVAVHRPVWTARASLLVLPEGTSAEADALAGLYDTLSRGQVPATFAELLRQPGRTAAVLQSLPDGPPPRDAVQVEVEVVPDTSVLEVRARAGDAATAELVADTVTAAGNTYLQGLDSPYTTRSVGPAAGTARQAGLGRGPLAGLVLVLALAAGLTAQQLAQHVTALPGRRVRTPAGDDGDGSPDAPLSLPTGDAVLEGAERGRGVG